MLVPRASRRTPANMLRCQVACIILTHHYYDIPLGMAHHMAYKYRCPYESQPCMGLVKAALHPYSSRSADLQEWEK